MGLRVTLAGRVGLESDAAAIEGKGLGRPGRLALAYLVSERHRSVSRDQLAEVLWGEALPASWEQMLRGIVFRLRAMLSSAGLDGAKVLNTRGGCYQLHLPADTIIDVEEAAAALEAARAALEAGYAGAAHAHAARAVDIAARGFAPATSGMWVEHRQAELRELHLGALEALAQAALAEGRWSAAASAAAEVEVLEPYRESAYVTLMAAHAGAGSRGEALRAYDRCRAVLAEELGVDPSPATEAAYMALLDGDLGPPPTPPGAGGLPLPSALDAVPGSFLVGREREMEALAVTLTRASVEGRQGVLVGGEPGVGKTALVAEAARSAHAQGARVLYGRCDEELDVPYQPFAQALSHYVAHAPLGELRAHVAAHGGVLARLVPTLSRRLPDAVPPPTVEPQSDRWLLFEAVKGVLEAAAVQVPVVLVLDDLHWAAGPTLLLVRHLLADPSPAALVTIGTYRHSEVSASLAHALVDLRRAPAVERLTLEGLDEAGVVAFMAATGAASDDAALARAVHAHTAGNPFFLGELLRHLAEKGAVSGGNGESPCYVDGFVTDVPEGVREVVARRIAQLSEPARHVLRVAAVAGAEFDLEVIERAADGADSDTTLDALEEATTARLLVETTTRPGRYRFAHALVRDTLYGVLIGTRRARLHRAVGEAVEALPGEDPARLATLAHHYAEAAIAGCATKAADYALAAAERAMGQAAWDQALAHLQRGLAVLRPQDPRGFGQRCDLLLAIAEIRAVTAEYDMSAVRQACLLAAEAARAAGSAQQFARAAATFNQPRDPGGEVGRQLCEEALASLGDEDPALRARILVGLAQSRSEPIQAGDAPRNEAVRLAVEALELARRSGDPDALWAALRLRCSTLLGCSDPNQLLALADELVTGKSDKGWVGHRFRAIALLALGDRAGFNAAADEVARIGSHLRLWLFDDTTRWWRVSRALLDGRFDDVEELASAAVAAHGPYPSAGWFMIQMGALRREQGRLGELSDGLRSSVDDVRRPFVSGLSALANIELFEHDRARQELETQVANMAAIPLSVLPATLALLAEVASALGEITHALALYEALRPYAGTAVVFWMGLVCLGATDRYLGSLATALGRWAEAEEHFLRALAFEERLDSPPLLARTRLCYGQSLLARGRPGDAEQANTVLSSCWAEAVRLGMGGVATSADGLLRSAETPKKRGLS